MKFAFLSFGCAAVMALSACDTVQPEEPTVLSYTSPEQSGLSPARPYPNPDDVCQLLDESDKFSLLKSSDRELIACPKHEMGAIEDRRNEGARVVANTAHWVVMSIAASRIK